VVFEVLGLLLAVDYAGEVYDCTVTTEQDSDRYNLEISIEKELKIEHDHIAKTGVRTQTQR
jgi:hypothetical protein